MSGYCLCNSWRDFCCCARPINFISLINLVGTTRTRFFSHPKGEIVVINIVCTYMQTCVKNKLRSALCPEQNFALQLPVNMYVLKSESGEIRHPVTHINGAHEREQKPHADDHSWAQWSPRKGCDTALSQPASAFHQLVCNTCCIAYPQSLTERPSACIS